MNEITRISIDTSKSAFTLHAVDAYARAVLRRNLRRRDMEPFFRKLPPVEVVMEACGGSHHWARFLQGMGHRVRLIPAQYVKPFVKRGKNDRNDAEAISEAANRPGMHDVAIKSADTQARAMLLSVRELLVRQRTQMVNALRGHAAEMGLVAARVTVDLTSCGPRSRPMPRCPKRPRRRCTRAPRCVGMVTRFAGAQAAQARGGGSGQQDGPHCVGHADERGGLPAHNAGSRLKPLVRPQV